MGACVVIEASSFQEAVQQLVWVDVMVEGYDSIVRNSVWDVVLRLEDKSFMSSHWIYKVKQVTNDSVEKHKARFVAHGFSHVEGIEYDDTFSPATRYSLIRSILVVLAHMGDEKIIKSCKDLAREFEMKDMGLMHYFLGMEVWQGDGELLVSQGKYSNEILRKFCMESSKPMETPLASKWRKEDAASREIVEATVYWQLVGSLM
eukprot:PITA_10983